MRKIVLTLLSCLFMSLCFAQNDNVLTEDLQKILNQKGNELIEVNIFLKSKMPAEHLTNLGVKSDSRSVRREIVVNELKKFSEQSQQNVLSVINAETRSSNVIDVKSHWLVNYINCKASRDVIYQLAQHPDIKYIDYSSELELCLEGEQEFRNSGYQGKRDAVTQTGKLVSDNITHVQADKVWDLGYTGKGIIVAVLDSGFNTDHVDLKDHLWYDEGASYPGYNFVFNSQPPTDDSGHGTHCAGTVCGDGTSGLTTGMAPDATLMPLKITNRSTGVSAGLDRMVAAVEYAVENGADIISISVGFWSPSAYIKEALREAFTNSLQADVVVAQAAGNNRQALPDYPAPNNINTPGDCPPPWFHPDQTTQVAGTNTSVICVGGIDENNTIIGVSSQGPVTWTNTKYEDYPYNPGMGLIRPDIVAPGAGVKSLDYQSNDGYEIKAGTSQAAPCVAGVMALMLEKNPDLTPADLCRIIETTATKLTDTKSNDYGSGCINALAAVQAVEFNVNAPYLNQYSFTKNITAGSNQDIELTLINNGKLATNGTTNVTITTDDNNITIVDGNATYAAMAANATATGNFTIKVSELVADNYKAILNVNAGNNRNFEIEINVSNPLLPPSSVSASASGKTITLSWNETNHATSYNIYRDNVYIDNVTSTSYVDEDLEYGTVYGYTITSKRVDLESEHSIISRAQTEDNPEKPSPTNVKATVSNNNVNVTWSNGNNSQSANVYRLKDNTEKTTLASDINANAYTDNSWSSLADGIYQYGVANNYPTDEVIYEEGFDSINLVTTSTTTGWYTSANWSGSYKYWSFTASTPDNFGKFDKYLGEKAAFINNLALAADTSYLVTPQFNFSEYNSNSLKLSFYYITPAWTGYPNDINTLQVKISTTSNSDGWGDLWSSGKKDISEWTKVEIDLSAYANSSFYIAFVNVPGGGYCTGVDEMKFSVEVNSESRIEWAEAIHKNVNVFSKDGDWNNTDNWATKRLPTENDTYVTIDANAIIYSGEITVNSLTINEGKSLTINSGAKLIVNNDFSNNDPNALIINDGAQVVHNSENLPATFNMNITNPTNWSTSNTTGWQFIASPVKNAKISDFIPENSDYDLYKYDGTKNLEWLNHKDENEYEEEEVIIDTVTIGEGTISRIAAPIYNAGSTTIYSLSQQIYTNEEIGCDGGSIKSIAFHQAAGNNNMRDIVVYLQNNTKASYTGSTDWVSFSDADIVYQGIFDFGKAGDWVTIELQNTFEYTGDNLVVTVYDKTGTGYGDDYDICDKFYYSQIDEWRGMYVTSLEGINLSSLSTSHGTKMMTSNWDTPKNVYYLNNIKIGIACNDSNAAPTVPTVPQNLVATAISSSEISLSWNSVKKATSYNIYEEGESIATNITETTYIVEGLTAETEHCYTITAVNEVGESEMSEEACATTLKSAPAAPVVTATPISSSQIQLSWEAVDGATGYNVYSNGYNLGPITGTSYTMGYLQANKNYCFQVSAINEVGESELTEACATTLNAKPIAPELTATATGETTIALSWNTVNRAASYNVYQGSIQIASGLTETTYTVENLEPETNYCFTVTAVNEVGESEKSTEVCAMTNEKAPTMVEVGTNPDCSGYVYLPVYDYSSYSISQQIYTNSEIGLGNGEIRSVSFRVGDKGNAATRKYEVYLKNISENSFAEHGYEYFELSSSDKVYDGDVAVGGKQEWFTINFTTPFQYTGGNVVLCVYDKTGTSLSNYHNFYKYEASGRSFYNSGYYVIDPTTLMTNASGQAQSYVNQIKFGFILSEITAPIAPSLSATAISSSEISLTWNNIAIATSYNVYQGSTQIASGLTEKNYTVEGLDAETEYCFTVTAVNEVGESDKSAEACATTEEDLCVVEFILGDTWGDGWNGNTMTINGSDGTSDTLTLPNGYTSTTIYEFAQGAHVVVKYIPYTGLYGAPNENSFIIRYKDDTEIYNIPANTFEKGKEYTYEFDVDCTPKAPNAPELTAEANNPSSISLTWNDVAKASSYNVYQDNNLITSGLTEKSYIVEGLETGTEYCFTVTAVNEVGESEVSNEECVMTKGIVQGGGNIVVSIGEGSTEDQAFLPLQANYDNTISEQIFLADDFKSNTGKIISYAFKSAKDLVSYGTPVTVTRNFKVYMINTDKASFNGVNDWVNMTNSDLVFNGSVTVQPEDTWTTITFDTPFEYEAGKNVILCIHAEGSWNALSGNYYKHTTDNVRSLCFYADGQVFDATNITVASKFDNLNYVAQSQFTFESANVAKGNAVVNNDIVKLAQPSDGVFLVNPFENEDIAATRNNSRSKFESAFQQGVGYLASYEKLNSATFIGNLNHEKSYNFPVAYNSDKDLANFHLLGNPFSFNMKWGKVVSDHLATGYAVVNEQGGYTYYTDGEIKVGDGFFVKAIEENPSFYYNEEQRSRDIERLNINVVVNGNAGSDNVVINLADTDNEGFPKFKNFNEEIATIFVNENGKSYGVFNADKDVNEIPLYFRANEMGRYNISIEANGIFENITLVDLISGKETDMLMNDYSFTATSKEDRNRFIVRFTVSDKQSAVNNFVYQSGKDLIINAKGTVQIVDVMGRIIYDNIEAGENTRIDVSNFRTGTYIVRLVSETEVKTQKVVVY